MRNIWYALVAISFVCTWFPWLWYTAARFWNEVADVRVVVATIDAGLDIERFREHIQRLLVLALFPVDNGDDVVRRRHTLSAFW